MEIRYVLKYPSGQYLVVDPNGRRFAPVSSQRSATKFDREHAYKFREGHQHEGLTPVRLKPVHRG